MKSLFPEAEVTKSLYNKVFKNNQVTYGRPFQLKVPINLQVVSDSDTEAEGIENPDDTDGLLLKPEKLLEKARQECDLLIREANAKANSLLEQARLQAEKEAEGLLEEARQNGYADGMEAAHTQYESILAQTEQIRQSAAQEHNSIMAGMETEILELVLKIAHKAVAGELAVNKDVILQLIKDALPNCSNINGSVLRVSPLDSDYLNDNKEKLFAVAEGADRLEIKKDSTLKPGDCIIETPLGSVDAGVNTRLDKIEEAFRGQLEGR